MLSCRLPSGSEGAFNISGVKLKPVSGKGSFGKADPPTKTEPAKASESLTDSSTLPPKPPVNSLKPSIGGKLKSSSVNKPSVPQKSKISNLMKQFGEGSADSEVSSTTTSPRHLARPPPPPLDVSPMSGRKMDRKNSVGDGIKMFGGRSPSPDIKPSLPLKHGGSMIVYGII